MTSKRKPKKQAPTPFTFYNEKDYQSDLMYSREFSNQDAIAKIILYRIDTVQTKTSNIYGEAKAKNKKFLPPIDLNVTMIIDDISNSFMSKNGINRENINLLKFGVFQDEMEEKSVSINRGDFLKYFDGEKYRIFEITKVSNINSNNSMYGYKPFFIEVESTMSLSNVILD